MSDTVLYALRVTVGMDASEFLTGRTALQRDMAGLRDGLKSFGDQWMQTGKRLTLGITAPLAAFGFASVKAASDAEELDSAFGVTFGKMADDMRHWADQTGDALGRSSQDIKNAANAFGIFFNQAAPTRKEAAEMSKTFTVLAQDLASFFNTTEDDALQKLRSGLSGESEPLRDFGVFLSEAAVANKALEMGLAASSKELTEQDKILARYKLILEGTSAAQGDVARTSGSAANQSRSFFGALQDLQVVIGEKLLPLLTPIVEGATGIINAFTNLPSPIQNVIIAFGAFAAALGPLMLITGTLAVTLLPLFAARFGPIGIAISAFINPLGTAISLLGQFVLRIAGMAILQSIGGLLLRFLGPVGLLVTAGTLIYQNWGRIAPVFEEFWQKAQATLGPPLQELIATISRLFDEFWNGPMGEGVRAAIALAQEFGAAASDIFGDVLVTVLEGALDLVILVFEQIGDAIRIVNALLNGDFAGAWAAAQRIMQRFVEPARAVADAVVGFTRQLYEGVKTWLMDKLGAVFDWVGKKVQQVSQFFFEMYDAVVGNSYVPDMVDGIRDHFGRLKEVMVDPALRAAKQVQDAFRNLYDRLYPDQAERRKFAEELGLIAGSDLSDAEKDDFVRRLEEERFRKRTSGLGKAKTTFDTNPEGPLPEVERVKAAVDGMIDTFDKGAKKTEVQTVRIAETVADMARNISGSIKGLVDGIKSGDFFSIFDAVLNVVTTLGGAGLFGSGFRDRINSTPGFANGGAMVLGGMAGIDRNILSLNGSPIARVSAGETMQIRRGGAAASGGVVNNYYTLPSDEFWNRVDGRAGNIVAAAAPSIARDGASQALGRLANARGRSLV